MVTEAEQRAYYLDQFSALTAYIKIACVEGAFCLNDW